MSNTHYDTDSTQPGWYTDPGNPHMVRYFDGTVWTEAVKPATGAPSGYQPPPGTVSNTYSTIAIVLGVLALLFLPIVLGPIGIVLAAIGFSKKEPRAPIGMAVAIGGLVLGMILGALAFTAAYA